MTFKKFNYGICLLLIEKIKIIDDKITDNGIWEEVGHRLNNYTWVYFILEPNSNYRIFYIYNDNDDKTNPIKKKLEFSTTEKINDGIFILDNIKKINELYITLKLDLKPLIFNKIFFENCNNDNCYIFTLEKLKKTKINNYKIISNTLDIIPPDKINMEKPIKIISNSLETHELEENYWKIEYNIPPTPYIPQWQEVGTKVNINHIKYTFKSNTKYKIYYNFESQSSIKKFAFMCKEFLYGELNTDVQTLYWDKANDRIMVSLQMQNDSIAIVSDPTRYGQLLKLEELQE